MLRIYKAVKRFFAVWKVIGVAVTDLFYSNLKTWTLLIMGTKSLPSIYTVTEF